ncbi:hypothetical protein CEXT_343721 [Caerostris extrusa]|uniref:Uncharacterized protein n=1 Tax=Caerostris extrusa TaxID=172846 RepID=A0AAV4TH54_CAEEX|nr:hypothetical protein CEXT_343721 [Caerostris extrusa]
MGHAHAQHAMGHKYLNRAGVKRNHTAAFNWFRKAADQGHAHSAYNLAVGHMQGYDTDVKKRVTHDLIKYAVDKGVEEAHDIYHRVILEISLPGNMIFKRGTVLEVDQIMSVLLHTAICRIPASVTFPVC